MRRLPAGVAAVVMAVVLGAVSACSTMVPRQTAEPAFTSSFPASTSGKLPVPKVSNPLDISRWVQQPCKLLSADQAVQVANWTTNSQSAGNVAPFCTWEDHPETGRETGSMTIGFVPGLGGLRNVYVSQDSESGYFEVAPDIGGYPAVFSSVHDDRKKGGCMCGVGLSDNDVITIDVMFDKRSQFYSDPCPVAVRGAEAVVSTLKGGG